MPRDSLHNSRNIFCLGGELLRQVDVSWGGRPCRRVCKLSPQRRIRFPQRDVVVAEQQREMTVCAAIRVSDASLQV